MIYFVQSFINEPIKLFRLTEKTMRFLFNFVRNNKITLLKYGTIGATSAVIDFSLYITFTRFVGLYYIFAATLSFIFAAIYNFSFNRKWTFQSNGKKRKQLPVFLLVAGTGLLLNNGIIAVGVEVFALWDILAKIIAAGIVTLWNFFGNKYITFKIK
ncbi:MAG: hypothetical protein C3F02_00055 [Parcubacteria group bacterium]|nr:MAG: hypothetical protein C3F02_00055 [Parcubacteria group bacterium]